MERSINGWLSVSSGVLVVAIPDVVITYIASDSNSCGSTVSSSCSTNSNNTTGSNSNNATDSMFGKLSYVNIDNVLDPDIPHVTEIHRKRISDDILESQGCTCSEPILTPRVFSFSTLGMRKSELFDPLYLHKYNKVFCNSYHDITLSMIKNGSINLDKLDYYCNGKLFDGQIDPTAHVPIDFVFDHSNMGIILVDPMKTISYCSSLFTTIINIVRIYDQVPAVKWRTADHAIIELINQNFSLYILSFTQEELMQYAIACCRCYHYSHVAEFVNVLLTYYQILSTFISDYDCPASKLVVSSYMARYSLDHYWQYAEAQDGIFSDFWNLLKSATGLFKGTFEAVIKAATSVATTTLTKSMNFLANTLDPTCAVIGSVLNSISSVITKLFAALNVTIDWVEEKADDIVTGFESLFNLISLRVKYVQKNTAKLTRVGLAFMLVVLGVWIACQVGFFGYNLLSKMLDILSKFSSSYTRMEPQGANVGPGELSIPGTIISLICIFVCGWEYADHPIINNIGKLITRFAPMKASMEKALSCVCSLLPACISRFIFTLSPDSSDAVLADISDFITDVNVARVFSTTPSAIISDEYVNILSELMTRGDALVKRVSADSNITQSPLYAPFFQSLSQITALTTNIVQIRRSSEARPRPTWVHFFGDAGAGKTFFVQNASTLFAGIRRFDGKSESCPKSYVIPTASQYWDGFQQDVYPITVFEEIWGVLDGQSALQIDYPNTLLQLMSSATFMPPMAAITSGVVGMKGTTFNSTLFLSCHNNALPNNWGGDAYALARRMNYIFKVIAPTSNNPYCETQKMLDSKGNVHDVTVQYYCGRKGIDSDQDCFMMKYAQGEKVVVKPCVLTVDLYRKAWRFVPYLTQVQNNTPEIIATELAENPADPNSLKTQSLTVDEVVSNILSTVDFNVAGFLKSAESSGLKYNLKLKESYDALYRAIVFDKNPQKVFDAIVDNQVDAVRDNLDPTEGIVNNTLEAADDVIDGVIAEVKNQSSEFQSVNSDSDPEEIYKPDGDEPAPAPDPDPDTAVSNAEAQGPFSKRTVKSSNDSPELELSEFDGKVDPQTFLDNSRDLVRRVTNAMKGGPRDVEDPISRKIIRGLVRTLPAVKSNDPIIVEPNAAGQNVSGAVLNAAFYESYATLFESLFAVVSTGLSYSPSLANCSIYFFGQTISDPKVPFANHPFFSSKFNTDIFYQYLSLIRPVTTIAAGFPPEIKSHPLFIIAEDSIYYLVDRNGTVIRSMDDLRVGETNSYGVSNYDFAILSPTNPIASGLLYWNENAYQLVNFDPVKNVSALVSNGQTARSRGAYSPFIIQHSDDPFAPSCYQGGWKICVHCLRCYHPVIYPLLEGSKCTSIVSHGYHSLIELSEVSSANLSALSFTVPKPDYSYFCSMAVLTLALSKLTDGTKRVEHRSLHFTYDLAKVINESQLLKGSGKDVLEAASSMKVSTSDSYGVVDTMPSIPVLYDDDVKHVDVIDNSVINKALTPQSHSFISYVVIGASLCGVVYALYKSFFPSKAKLWESQSEPPTRVTAAIRRNNNPKYSHLSDLKTVPNAVLKGEAESAVQMTTAEVTVDGVTIKGFMPMSNIFVTYTHSLVKLLKSHSALDSIEVKVHLSSGDREYYLRNYEPDPNSDVVVDLENDLLAWKLPPQVQSVPDRLSLLCTNDELASVVNNQICFAGNGYHYATCTDTPITYQAELLENQVYEYYHRHSCSYPIPTSKGDCGTLIYCVSGPAMNKVVAMHVAGFRFAKTGAGVWLSREVVIGLLNELGVYNKQSRSKTTVVEVVDTVESQGPNSFYNRLKDLSGPNLVSITRVPPAEQVNLPDKTAYVPTGFVAHPDYKFKQPAIMNCEDSRAKGRDPVHINLEEMCSIDVPEVNEDLVKKCSSIQIQKLHHDIDFPIGARELTFEEAILGVPKYLSSIKLESSAGYPLTLYATDKGKKSFIWFEGDVCYVDRTFKNQVLEIYSLLKAGDRAVFDKYPFYWLGFEKDELRKQKKIDGCQTRMIFCNSLLYTVAFRMLFGSLLCAFNCNAGKSIFASGLNINSKDCHLYYSQLRKVDNPNHAPNLIVGDYSGFDRHYHPLFQKYAYEAMYDLILSKYENPPPRCAWDLFVEHELSTNVQIGDARLKFKHSHFSGCFFTTPENCLVNELYFMYCFYSIYPEGDWSDIQFIALGDDHLVAVPVEKYPEFNMIKVYEVMKEIGQVYTDANKNIPTVPFYSYIDSTFLGSAPKYVSDSYVGALSLETLYGNLGYMTKKTDFVALIESFLDLASIHDEKTYQEYWNWINMNSRAVYGRTFAYNYIGRRNRQYERSALSNDTFVFCYAQGPTTMNDINPESTVPTVNEPISEVYVAGASKIKPSTLTIGTDSLMHWFDFTWTSTNPRGYFLAHKNLPGDALKTNILQVLPFAYNSLWRGDVEICFQVNGTPFMAGALIVYFNPLRHNGYSTAIENSMTGEHVILQACNSDSVTFLIPYRYFNELMSTDKMIDSPSVECLGSLHVAVLSPLVSATATSVSVSVWVRFPNSQFFNPKKPHTLAEAQGPSGSGSSNLSLGDLLGLVPGGETALNAINTVSKVAKGVSKTLNTKFIPLDNTPVAGGSLPTSMQFPSMSKAYGAYPTTSLQLDPSVVYGKSRELFDAGDTKLSSLVARTCILKNASWTTSQTPGTSLVSFPLSSTCTANSSTLTSLPMNLAIANCFQYMHCDFEIGITAFKTRFHSGRLRATVNYGGSETVNGNYVFSQVIDFSGEACTHKVLVPWSFIREYMVTAQGSYNESLGLFTLEILNPLVAASSNVAASVDVMITISLVNASFAVPTAIPPFNTAQVSIGIPQGPEQDDAVVETDVPEVLTETATTKVDTTTPMSNFHVVDDIMELARRMRPVNISKFERNAAYQTNFNSYALPLHPYMLFGADLFSAYAGGIHLRVKSNMSLFSYLPLWTADTNGANYFAYEINGLNKTSGFKITGSDNLYSIPYELPFPLPDGSNYFDCIIPYQMPFNFIAGNKSIVSAVPDTLGYLFGFTSEVPTGFCFMGAADDGLFGYFNPPSRFYRTTNKTKKAILLGSLFYPATV
ncbi:polyprotein [Posavirus sp.]|nr:polyprotein [Posavirus sp.]